MSKRKKTGTQKNINTKPKTEQKEEKELQPEPQTEDTQTEDTQTDEPQTEEAQSDEPAEHVPDFSQMEKNKKKGFKSFLHKFFRIILILLVAIFVVNLIIVLVAYINHRNKLADERGYLFPTGELVDVNGYDVHVVVTGDENADTTLVFLHSTGVTDDSVALQPLFAELQDYRLVYIDRSGFGYSDNPKVEKDIDSILEETRTALAKSGIDGPYILVPNGMAGVYAGYWAKKYADEVDGVVGINISLPEDFEGITEEQYCGIMNYLMTLFSKIGGHRLVKSVYPENIGAVYTEKQMLVRNALISRGFYTSGMYEEDLQMIANVAKAKELGWQEETPMLFLLANPLMEPYITDDSSVKKEYEDALKEIYGSQTDADSENPDGIDYIGEFNLEKREQYEKYSNVELLELSGPSRLYTYNPVEVAAAIRDFAQMIHQKN